MLDYSEKNIPKWINKEDIKLDQFYTNEKIAKKCFDIFDIFLKKENISLKNYYWLEPSAGTGSFYKIMPKNKMGFDLDPKIKGIEKKNYLNFIPEDDKKYIVLGNPPFGKRGWLALEFMNHSNYADYVGFILPMGFDSEGKGSLKYRVKGLTLKETHYLENDSFYKENGENPKINCVFQIYKKGIEIKKEKIDISEYVDVYLIQETKDRSCGLKYKKECDLFLQYTFYNNKDVIKYKFEEIRGKTGIGLNIKKEKEKIKKLLMETNWVDYSSLATNNCRHISKYHVEKLIKENMVLN